MFKPVDYDQVMAKVKTGRKRITVGPHKMIIVGATECIAKSGKAQIAVMLDVVGDDPQAGIFTAQYNDFAPGGGKWPRAGITYVPTYYKGEDGKDYMTEDLAIFLSKIAASNPGFQAAWGDGFGASLRGKVIGAVYGEVESDYTGQVRRYIQIRWLCRVDELAVQETPEPKLLDKSRFQGCFAPQQQTGFLQQGGFQAQLQPQAQGGVQAQAGFPGGGQSGYGRPQQPQPQPTGAQASQPTTAAPAPYIDDDDDLPFK